MPKPTNTTNPSGGVTIAEFSTLAAAINAGTVPLPGVCETMVGGDTKLFELWRQYQAIRAEITQLSEAAADEAHMALWDKSNAIVDQIRDERAITPWGVLLQLRAAAAELRDWPNNTAEELLASAVVQMESQIGGRG